MCDLADDGDVRERVYDEDARVDVDADERNGAEEMLEPTDTNAI